MFCSKTDIELVAAILTQAACGSASGPIPLDTTDPAKLTPLQMANNSRVAEVFRVFYDFTIRVTASGGSYDADGKMVDWPAPIAQAGQPTLQGLAQTLLDQLAKLLPAAVAGPLAPLAGAVLGALKSPAASLPVPVAPATPTPTTTTGS